MERNCRILTIIPAFNEAGSLPMVIKDLRTHFPQTDILVVDDGSFDRTSDTAKQLDVMTITLPVNLGVGGAMQAGYMFAYKMKYDIAVQFDGDGQHRALDIPALITPLQAGLADMVIGSRLEGGVRYRFPFSRYIGSRLLAKVISRIAGQVVTDPTSGFRAVNKQAIEYFHWDYPQMWLGDTAEAIVQLARHGMRFTEVRVKARQRKGSQSTVGLGLGCIHAVCILIAILVDCIERKIPYHKSK